MHVEYGWWKKTKLRNVKYQQKILSQKNKVLIDSSPSEKDTLHKKQLSLEKRRQKSWDDPEKRAPPQQYPKQKYTVSPAKKKTYAREYSKWKYTASPANRMAYARE